MDPKKLSDSLTLACFSSPTIVKMLEYGVLVDNREDWKYFSMMVRSKVEIIKLIVEHGLKWKDVAAVKYNALHFCDTVESAKYFVELGADINITTVIGYTPLIFAASWCNLLQRYIDKE